MLKKKVILHLGRIVGKENILTDPEDLVTYSYDAVNRKFFPDAVLFPSSPEEISAILKVANQEQFPVIPRGAGSGFTGGTLAVRGGVIVAMNHLNRIISIDIEDLTAIVEPGVVCGDFKKAAECYGLYYPPDPASLSFSTLGGNVAECAGGPSALKYGVTRDYVTGLEVVLPTGEVITTGTKTTKGVVGYDLTRLIIGSEGTLAIVTKIYLRLIPKPESALTLLALFKDMEAAAKTVAGIIRGKIVPSKLEFMDQTCIECVENYRELGLPLETKALLLIELDGDPVLVGNQADRVETICREFDAFRVAHASSQEEAERLWEIRQAISPSLLQLNLSKINEDIVVPRSKIPYLVHRIEELQHAYQLKVVNFGHAGDGNIHVNVMFDNHIPGEDERAHQMIREIFQAVLEVGGTISGEHGVGITKAPFLSMELREAEIALMKRIKQVFDPNDILNPGKIFYGA